MTIVYTVNNALYVNLTNRCPCACTFCIRRNGEGAYGSQSLWLEREPTLDEVNAAIDGALAERKYGEIVFCGYGEPTERLDTLLAVSGHIRERHPGLAVRVNTNGLSDLIAGEPTAAKFAGLVDAISISLNAPDAEEYCELCRPRFGLESYGAMLKFAAEVSKFVEKTILSIVATPDTTEEKIAACRKIADGLGVQLRVRRYES